MDTQYKYSLNAQIEEKVGAEMGVGIERLVSRAQKCLRSFDLRDGDR